MFAITSLCYVFPASRLVDPSIYCWTSSRSEYLPCIAQFLVFELITDVNAKKSALPVRSCHFVALWCCTVYRYIGLAEIRTTLSTVVDIRASASVGPGR